MNNNDLPREAFGANAAEQDYLAQLICEGIKTATCSTLAAYQQSHTPLPKVGQRFVVVDGRRHDRCIAKIMAVDTVKFCDVDAAFAHAEGEGDRSLEYWRREHQAFFEHYRVFAHDMELVQEWFHVIKIL